MFRFCFRRVRLQIEVVAENEGVELKSSEVAARLLVSAGGRIVGLHVQVWEVFRCASKGGRRVRCQSQSQGAKKLGFVKKSLGSARKQ